MVGNEDENYLPDLPDEISGEQLVFQQKVFRANEAFNKANIDIINWFNSPSEKRQYPKSRLKNKNLFRKQMKKYDYVDGTLFKYVKGLDSIGKV